MTNGAREIAPFLRADFGEMGFFYSFNGHAQGRFRALRRAACADLRRTGRFRHIDPAHAGIIHGTGSWIQEDQGEVILSNAASAQSQYAHVRLSEFSIDVGKITITGPHLYRPLRCNQQLP